MALLTHYRLPGPVPRELRLASACLGLGLGLALARVRGCPVGRGRLPTLISRRRRGWEGWTDLRCSQDIQPASEAALHRPHITLFLHPCQPFSELKLPSAGPCWAPLPLPMHVDGLRCLRRSGKPLGGSALSVSTGRGAAGDGPHSGPCFGSVLPRPMFLSPWPLPSGGRISSRQKLGGTGLLLNGLTQ